jgi:thymidylate synthase (FAD)
MMRVKLLSFTPNPDSVVYAAARCCYDDVDMTDESYSLESFHQKDISKLVNHLYLSGHTSTFEHVSFTFAVNGISRVCSHQLVRHRIGVSYSQQSQRYIKMNTNKNMEDVVVPPSIKNKQSAYDLYRASVDTATSIYHSLISMGIPKEDARYVLPHSWNTQLSITMNARSLLHFFNVRLCKRSQWEIRELARRMYQEVRYVAPLLFNFVGPSCIVEGKCKEVKSCGQPYKDMFDFDNTFIIDD